MNDRKRFKREQTLIEDLPNELFVEIFGYLNGVDAVYAFHPLNKRLSSLLNVYVNSFNFESISRTKFRFIAQVHPINEWRSLTLSNDDRTPGQISFFTESFPFGQYVPQLESLTFLSVKPAYASILLQKVDTLKNLVSLTIEHVCGFNLQPIDLPSLKRLTVTTCKDTNWITNFLTLHHLQYTIEYNCSHAKNLIIPVHLQEFRVFYEENRDGADIRQLLRQMPHLTKLALFNSARHSPLPNGRMWEELIISSLPLLKTFQFFFAFDQFLYPANDLTEVIASFSTPFYLDEKRWFIRCDRDTRYLCTGALYSLPFAFQCMSINTCSFDTSLSTLPTGHLDETKSHYYRKVNTVIFNEECKAPHLGFLSFNIRHLILKANLPRSWVYLLEKLRYLQITHDVSMSSIDFAQLLNHAPNLESLTIPIQTMKTLTDNFTDKHVCDRLSKQIRSLTLSHHYLDAPNLGIISVRLLNCVVRIFSTNCQHLSLALVAHPKTVRPVLRRMRALRSLHIYWPYVRLISQNPIESWLDQQSTDYTATDYAHVEDRSHLFMWFGNRI